MKEPYGEELATHSDPESCVGPPQDGRRSVDRGTRGPGIEPRNVLVWGADVVVLAEGNTRTAANARRILGPTGSETLRTRGNSLHGNREALPLAAKMATRSAWGT